jgi:adenosylhomocysteine nucleosidase
LRHSPALIVNTGVGEALAGGITTGDIVIADKLCQHDMDTSAIGDPKGLVSGINKIYFDADPRAVEILTREASALGLSMRVGTIASGDKFIASREDKERIISEFSASACEMEGCAVAQVAFVNDTPFAVVRAISDSADGEATMDYPTFLPIAARNSTNLTLALIKAW